MSNIPQDYLFSSEHEWVKIEGTKAKIGITDYAQHKLGDITYVEMASVGKVLNQGAVVTGIESVKAASDIYAPVSGKNIAANNALETEPELVNKAPYTDGWIAQLETTAAPVGLMDAAAYVKFLEGLEK